MSTGETGGPAPTKDNFVVTVPKQTLFNVVLVLAAGAAIAYFGYGKSGTSSPFVRPAVHSCPPDCNCDHGNRRPFPYLPDPRFPNGGTGATDQK